jgi:hypothetical protein
MSARRNWLILVVALAACGRSGLNDLLPEDTVPAPSAVGAAGTGATGTGAAGTGAAGTGAAGTGAAPQPGPNVTCPCSRAPGGRLISSGVTCPPGTGASQMATIGVSGGSLGVSTATGRLVLEVPPGAIAGPRLVRVTELARPTPVSHTDYSPIYEISPVDLQMPTPAKVTILWNLVLGPGAGLMSPAVITVYRATTPDGPWIPLMDSAINAGSSSATTDRFGYFFVGYPAGNDPAICRGGT